MYLFYGTPVYLHEDMVDKVWVFPEEKFVSYGPEDEWWARKYGFGHEVTRPKQEAVRIGDSLHFHPDTFYEFCMKFGLEVEPSDNDIIQITHNPRVLEAYGDEIRQRMSDRVMKSLLSQDASLSPCGVIATKSETPPLSAQECATFTKNLIALMKLVARRDKSFDFLRPDWQMPAVDFENVFELGQIDIYEPIRYRYEFKLKDIPFILTSTV